MLVLRGATACSDAPADKIAQNSGENTATVSSSNTSAATGTIVTSFGRYIFTPSHCGIGVEEGVDDIEIGGPGKSPDGEPIYVEYSSTADELEIKLGVDKPSTTSEHKFVAGQHTTQSIEYSVSGMTVRATGISLANGQGEIIDTEASFEINCSPAR